MGFKQFKNINIIIKLHYFVFYSPRNGHRIADKLNSARYSNCLLSCGHS